MPIRSPSPPGPALSPTPLLRPGLVARAEAVFHLVLESAAADREAPLVQQCGDDAELTQRVRRLLVAHENVDDLLNTEGPYSPEIEAELARLKPEEAGEHIGPYKLIEQIGQGGFGAVWMAGQ